MHNFESRLQKIEFAAQQGMSFNAILEGFSCNVAEGEESDAFYYASGADLPHAFLVLFAKLAKTVFQKAQYAEESSARRLCVALGDSFGNADTEFRREFCSFVAGCTHHLPVRAYLLLVEALRDRDFVENTATNNVRSATVAFCHGFVEKELLQHAIQRIVFACKDLVQLADDVEQACSFVTSTQMRPHHHETLMLVCGTVLDSISLCPEHLQNVYVSRVVDKMASALISCVKMGSFGLDEAESLHNMFALFCDTWSIDSPKRTASAATIVFHLQRG